MKLITEELMEAKLHELGFSEKQISEQNGNFTQLVLDHYDARVDDRWADQDLYVYEESTRDGYSVWICTHNPNSINIAEDVYYQEHNSYIAEEIQDAIRNGLSIYCDDQDMISEAIEDMCDRVYDDVYADVEMNLIDAGYAWPIKVVRMLDMCWETISNHNADGKYTELLDQITLTKEQLNIDPDNPLPKPTV